MEKNCKQRIEKNLNDRLKDLETFSKDGFSSESGFNDYGLSIDYVEPETFDNQDEGYLRFQLSWGGPSDEIRFYNNYIEYAFMDWFDGATKDVTNILVIQDLNNLFVDMGYKGVEYISQPLLNKAI